MFNRFKGGKLPPKRLMKMPALGDFLDKATTWPLFPHKDGSSRLILRLGACWATISMEIARKLAFCTCSKPSLPIPGTLSTRRQIRHLLSTAP